MAWIQKDIDRYNVVTVSLKLNNSSIFLQNVKVSHQVSCWHGPLLPQPVPWEGTTTVIQEGREQEEGKVMITMGVQKVL